jgi:hypothetical protein
MHGNSEQKRQHRFTDGKASGNRRGSSPPFQEREEDFADWVRKPLSVLNAEVSPSRAPHGKEQEKQKLDAAAQSDGSAPSNENLEKHR